MQSTYPWPIIPNNLEPSTASSLSMLFILQNFLFSLDFLLTSEDPAVKTEKQPEQYFTHTQHHKTNEIFERLYYYSEILLQASKIKDKTILLKLEKIRSTFAKIKMKFMLTKKKSHSCHITQPYLKTLFFELQQAFRSFFSSLFPFFLELKTDENVLCYLLEERQRFNLFLGSNTVETLFQSLFPSGPSELRTILRKGYEKRGFISFYLQKESLIDSILWDTGPSCKTPT